jgi:hypothetical protein
MRPGLYQVFGAGGSGMETWNGALTLRVGQTSELGISW